MSEKRAPSETATPAEYKTPLHAIEIDQDKCGDAKKCLKCVHTCIAQGLNCLVYVNSETPVVTADWPKSVDDIPHKVMARDMFMCNGCQKCIEACPKGCLTFVPARVHLPRAVVKKSPINVNCPVLRDGTVVVAPGYEETLIYADEPEKAEALK